MLKVLTKKNPFIFLNKIEIKFENHDDMTSSIYSIFCLNKPSKHELKYNENF